MPNFTAKHLSVLLLLISMSVLSCAYFNTFYNTKKYFNEALEESKRRTTDQPSASERQKFDKTISQASKVLQLYPDSKYVDDALLILGQSFYHIEDYRKAERKFQELIEFFPNSEKREEAQLWLAKTQISLQRYDLAFAAMQKLHQNAQKKDVRYEAKFWLGEAYFQQAQYSEATRELNEALQQINSDKLRMQTYKRLGESYLALESNFQAAESFQKAAKHSKILERQFDLKLQHAKALSAAEKHDEAIENLERLIAEHQQHKNISMAKLEMANAYLAKNADEKAIEIYNDIIEVHPRTEAAAGAYLALARYDAEVLKNYETAEQNYRQAALQDNRSEFAKIANEQAEYISNLRKLQQEISRLQRQITASESSSDSTEVENAQLDDSLDSMTPRNSKKSQDAVTSDELETLRANAQNMGSEELAALARNRKPQNGTSNPAQPPVAANSSQARPGPLSQANIDSINLLITEKKIELAESFYFDFGRADSALFYYLDAISGSNSKEHRALAFYSVSQIYEEVSSRAAVRDSVLKILAYNYQDTQQGQAARKQLGLQRQAQSTNQAEAAYQAAEELYLRENRPRAAEQKLLELLDSSPEDKLKVRTIYTLGWLNEHKLDDNAQALTYYNQLLETYPHSEFAKLVRNKVTAVKQEKQQAQNLEKEAAQAPTEQVSPASPDSAASAGEMISPTETRAKSVADSLKAASKKNDAQAKPKKQQF